MPPLLFEAKIPTNIFKRHGVPLPLRSLAGSNHLGPYVDSLQEFVCAPMVKLFIQDF